MSEIEIVIRDLFVLHLRITFRDHREHAHLQIEE